MPVKIDLFGRKGDFNTDLFVRSTSGEVWHIRVHGKVVEDIWYAGQSMRLYIEPDQEMTTREFSISTVDYPNVQFDFDTNDSDIHLSELSRSTQEGETKILFRLTRHNVDVVRTSARIELIPTNVDLPKLEIPVFYHIVFREQKQRLATSQINLGELQQGENITVKVYGDYYFLQNVHKVQAVSKDNVIEVVSYTVPVSGSDPLEIVVKVSEDSLNNDVIIRGSLTLFSHDSDEAIVKMNGIIIGE